jgi:hypothetical protein
VTAGRTKQEANGERDGEWGLGSERNDEVCDATGDEERTKS